MTNTASATYTFATSAHGINAVGSASATFALDITSAAGHFDAHGYAQATFRFYYVKKATPLFAFGSASYYDRFRFIVEDVHGNILERDLILMEPQISRALSGPCSITGKIHYNEPSVQKVIDAGGFKSWGFWIHAEKELLDGERHIVASGLVQPGDIDENNGILSLEAQGYSNYPKRLPWLVNWNPITVDPFEIFVQVWSHLQSYSNGNLGVTVYPTESGTQMLPGFGFDNEIWIQDFFAIFIREVDFLDCGDYLNKIARDIPVDYFERSDWNSGKTAIDKKIELAYPHGGVDQQGLIFRVNENVSAAKPKGESEIEWVSDIGIRGWFPNKVYSHQLSNADPDRYRRFLIEEDVHINSSERAKAWAHRQLTRRQIPKYWETITIDPYHPNAPFGSFDVGDTITVHGEMPWHGEVIQKHRIIGWTFDIASAQMGLKLMAEGAFNYDPIVYLPT